MDYIIPGFIIEEVFYGELSSKIDFTFSKYDISLILKDTPLDLDEFIDRFKAYICYLINFNEDFNQGIIFMEELKISSPLISTYITNFISIYVESNYSYKTVKDRINNMNDRYATISKNCMNEQFQELCNKDYDRILREEIDFCIKSQKISIDPDFLLTLTKCSIIESRKAKNSDFCFSSLKEAVEYSLAIYKQQFITFEQRKRKIDGSKAIMDIVNQILDSNDFSR